MAGYTYTLGGSARPTVWHEGSRIDLTTVEPGLFAAGGSLRAINDAGVVAGTLAFRGGLGFTYDLNTGKTWLLADTNSAILSANAINSQGNVAGSGVSTTTGNNNAALLAIPYGIVKLEDTTLGSSINTMAFGINDANTVVGHTIGTNGNSVGARWDGTHVTPIFGTSNNSSEAQDINNRDEIVGTIGGQGGILHLNGANYLLDSLLDPRFSAPSTLHIQIGNAINDSSWIAGYGLVNGVTTAVILAPVPESSTLAMALLGILVVAGQVRSTRSIRR